jgi:hypothetical protein
MRCNIAALCGGASATHEEPWCHGARQAYFGDDQASGKNRGKTAAAEAADAAD